jgi:thymidine kinase
MCLSLCVDVCSLQGQFFPDVVEFCDDWANRGKVVIVSALDGTFERKPFARILELIPLAEQVLKLNGERHT